MLTLIGLGLHDENDITLRGLEIICKADIIYLEKYTSKFEATQKKLEDLYKKQIQLVKREFVEQEDTILSEAKTKNVVLLIIGDPLSATTHFELYLRAKKEKIPVKIVHNASILTAIAITGLQLYKFGKIASIPFADEKYSPETYYDLLKDNKSIGAHTLFLLDVKNEEAEYMSAKDAIKQLLSIEEKRKKGLFKEDTLCIVLERAGSNDCTVISATAKDFLNHEFGAQPHVLIVPGELHFLEEEAITLYKLQENSYFHK
ncbi:diphthine synthase [Candidatus Woesearchaeota archaeon]|nr:diphthine synthase [Candidatus Woesearchaeota archaeon]